MTVLVTGGGGFLGQALCHALVARGVKVRSLARGDYPALKTLGVETARGDIADADSVNRAMAGCDAVFHVAAKAGVWGSFAEYYQANVVGTQNVLDACRRHGVSRLIHTSSPSVVYAGRDEAGIDESTPYPQTYLTHYPRTKAEAERLVLAANGPTLSTVALRPHLIWGPGDNHLVPRLIARAKAGKLRRVGDGRNRVDTTYIDNAVAAHLAAFDRLSPLAACAGKAYFIANNEPRPLWQLIDQMLACADLPPVKRSISASAAYAAGALLEGVYSILRWRDEPPMTRFVARQLSTDNWYDLTAAQRDLGYKPTVGVDEGLKRLRAWLQQTN
ncbi:MAG TPA: NAD-dependent epimerase/dehydratase family protein [Planctomycetaceae bacterium]|jgi:nucleoside-diphosphate-sugar epimerase|nr:NAD-dependent epimerase/dehydratase family protein [Planctomycetaceae bacterium]